MRILLDAHRLGTDRGGLERYTKNLAHQLNKRVQLVIYTNNEGWKITRKNRLRSSEPIRAYIPAMDNGLYRICFGFNKAIKKHRPDIIHVQNFSPIIKRIPIINTVHDLCFKDYSDTFTMASIIAFKFFFERSLFLSDIIICPSLHVRNKLMTNYAVDRQKIRVIYEGIDPVFKHINNKKIRPSLRNKYNLNTPYFLVVGGLNKRKKTSQIINAFQELTKEFRDISLVVVGSKRILSQEKNTIYIDNISDYDLNILYNCAVSLIYYSSCEGFGLPLIEAMSIGLPVIHSGLDVFKEIAGDVGLIANTDRGLVLAMKSLLTNPQLRDRCVSMGLSKSKNYSWETNARHTSDIYEEIYDMKY